LEIYFSLFAASVLAATLIPAQSESVLVGSILLMPEQVLGLVMIASFGNTLGAVVNWVLGRFFGQTIGRRLFSDTPRMRRITHWYQRYGWLTLFGSWIPIVGDPLTFCAGVMREPFWRFLLVVTFAKTLRYVVVAVTTLQVITN
jgi:membrane protein YqaA with SNARE-associated domain